MSPRRAAPPGPARWSAWLLAPLICAACVPAALAAPAEVIDPPPTAKQWADIAGLPDWSGVWVPDIQDQFAQARTNMPPWTPAAAAQVKQEEAEEAAGRPRGLFVDCLPEGMPAWMLVTHNALEFLFTPGRVTLLGESDGNRLRRIFTDGRPHPDDPDPTLHGHSIGHWEGDTLVVDTVAVSPEAYIATGEAVGLPNNGDLHVIERLHLVDANTLHDDLEIIAPRVLATPWKTTRTFRRERKRAYEIVEGECLQGSFRETVDKAGNSVFSPLKQDNGNVVPDTTPP